MHLFYALLIIMTTMQKKLPNNVTFLHDYRSLPVPRNLLNKIADKIYNNEKKNRE